MNELKFLIAHQMFEAHMLDNSPSGEVFSNFSHDFLRQDEIIYKEKAYIYGNDRLRLDQWHSWINDTGRVLEATKEACKSSASYNLIEHRYEGSDKALYRVSSKTQVASLEKALFEFFLGGTTKENEFGVRFDAFASYLRENHLGANWPFVAYLAFLLDKDRYFPIRPSKFDRLLEYYEVPGLVSGHVSWERYEILLNLANELRDRLLIYGPAKTIEIQSYMWVVSYLIEEALPEEVSTDVEIDFDAELKKRYTSNIEKDRIGLLGEKYVFEKEKTRLIESGHSDLAAKVVLVSACDSKAGYDISSFSLDGTPLHIEVKSTTYRKDSDVGFFLSENERTRGQNDPHWVVFRVWDVNNDPIYENIGNILIPDHPEWELKPSTWMVAPR